MISSIQAELARRLLGLSQQTVANDLGISNATLSKIENGESNPPMSRLQEIERYFSDKGVEFTEGDGVRRKQINVIRYRGAEEFRKFMDDVYITARDVGGEICLYNAKPQKWYKWLGEEWYKEHSERMQSIKHNYTFKVTTDQDERLFIGKDFVEYRWFSQNVPSDRAFYCYGNKLAFLNFDTDDVKILVLKQEEIAEAFKILFNKAWDGNTIVPSGKKAK